MSSQCQDFRAYRQLGLGMIQSAIHTARWQNPTNVSLRAWAQAWLTGALDEKLAADTMPRFTLTLACDLAGVDRDDLARRFRREFGGVS